MLINIDRSCLLVIDVQEKLIRAIQDYETIIANCAWLIKIANRLGVPILASEQYPKGLGHTIAVLHELVPEDSIMAKTHFSCSAEPACLARIDAGQREQMILIGIEAHVCVLQTALDLLRQGKTVYVAADCTGSRQPRDLELALARMRSEGVRVVSREMVVFEWLEKAGTEQFREISRDFLK